MENKELLNAVEAMFDRKIGGLEQRFDGLEQRFDGLEQRFDGLEQRFDGLEQRFDGLEQRLDGLEQEVKRHGEILQRHEDKLENQSKLLIHLYERMDRADSRIYALQAGQIDIRKDIHHLSEKLDMAYDTAVECWGQSVEAQKRIDVLEKKTEHLPEPKAG